MNENNDLNNEQPVNNPINNEPVNENNNVVSPIDNNVVEPVVNTVESEPVNIPVEPVTPAAPVTIAAPVEPEVKPIEPVTIAAPVEPEVKPVEPVQPVQPAASVVPAAPENVNTVVEPVNPAQSEQVSNVNATNVTPVQPVSTNNNASVQNSVSDKQKSNMKPLIIIGAIVVIIILVVIISLIFGKSSVKKVEQELNLDSPIRITKNGLDGYIDTNGKVLIEPKYTNASDFYGDYALIIDDDKGNEKYTIIDKKGNEVITSISRIKYVEDYDIWVANEKLYNGDLKQITSDDIKVRYEGEGYLSWTDYENNKSGIMNYKGKVTYTIKDSYVSVYPSTKENLKSNETYCIISKHDEEGIVNCATGKVVYDFADVHLIEEDDNVFEIFENETYETLEVFYIENDKVVYKTNEKKVEVEYYENGYLKIEKRNDEDEDKITYFNIKTGKEEFDRPSSSSFDVDIDSIKIEDLSLELGEGYKEVKCDDYKYKLTYKDKDVLECEWQDIDTFDPLVFKYLKKKNKPYVIADKDSSSYLINIKTGKVVKEFKYYVSARDSIFVYDKDNDNNKYIIYNLDSGKSIETSSDNSVYTYYNYFTIIEKDKEYYYNYDMKKIYETPYEDPYATSDEEEY